VTPQAGDLPVAAFVGGERRAEERGAQSDGKEPGEGDGARWGPPRTSIDGRTAALAAVAVVRSAVDLTAAQRSRLAEALAASYGHRVHLNVVIDPSVLGGISVRIGDELIDGTVASQLATVRRKLAG
jgi:hypothetical protein